MHETVLNKSAPPIRAFCACAIVWTLTLSALALEVWYFRKWSASEGRRCATELGLNRTTVSSVSRKIYLANTYIESWEICQNSIQSLVALWHSHMLYMKLLKTLFMVWILISVSVHVVLDFWCHLPPRTYRWGEPGILLQIMTYEFILSFFFITALRLCIMEQEQSRYSTL